MDLKQIKELMAAMTRAGIKKLTIKQKSGDELHLECHGEPSDVAHPPVATFYPPMYSHGPSSHREAETFAKHAAHSKTLAEEPVVEKKEEKAGRFVAAPLVGTYYASASPEHPTFVKVGDRVEENTVVCIIEAMKVMNEVKAGMSGTIAEIFVENAHPVEFGTKMFRIV
ncbi:MAG: acetyl-CoA carboxylase biotin carboxyl carrier protein [Chlamydiota bacterium]